MPRTVEVSLTGLACQLTAENLEEVADWCHGGVKGTKLPREQQVVEVHGGGDWHESSAGIGDWIVWLGKGHYMAFTAEEFDKLFAVKKGN